MLGKIKRILRTGSLPLQQAVKRISEMNSQYRSVERKKTETYPRFEKENISSEFKNMFPEGTSLFNKLVLKEYVLIANDDQNQWFLTHNNEVIKVLIFPTFKDERGIYGRALTTITDFFDVPIKSSCLNIFASDCIQLNTPDVYSIQEIKFKLVPIKYTQETVVFIPLLHSYSDKN